jgi:hypothetical protein
MSEARNNDENEEVSTTPATRICNRPWSDHVAWSMRQKETAATATTATARSNRSNGITVSEPEHD